MVSPDTIPEYTLRPAAADDARAIRQIIFTVRNNPLSLNWRRFILAVDREGKLIGCGQVKQHRDGSHELASIAVLPGWRGKGIAKAIISQLLLEHPGRIYLTCQSNLGPMYQKFGFQALQPAEMSTYFRRLNWIVASFNKIIHQPNRMLVMGRN